MAPALFPPSPDDDDATPSASSPPPPSDDGGLYAALNVPRDATPDDVRRAYRSLAAACHPDKVADPTLRPAAAEAFARLQRAYEVRAGGGLAARAALRGPAAGLGSRAGAGGADSARPAGFGTHSQRRAGLGQDCVMAAARALASGAAGGKRAPARPLHRPFLTRVSPPRPFVRSWPTPPPARCTTFMARPA